VTITGAGDCTITAKQPGGSNYKAATDVSHSFTVNKATPVFSNLFPSTIDAGSSPTTLGGNIKSGSLTPSGSVSILLNE